MSPCRLDDVVDVNVVSVPCCCLDDVVDVNVVSVPRLDDVDVVDVARTCYLLPVPP